jgi:hypothetical protein
MTLNQLLSNIQYGEEYTKKKTLKEELEKDFDKDLDLFYASKRIKKIAKNTVFSESEETKVNRLASKLVVIEDRLENGRPMSEGYRKMQASAIFDSCKLLEEEVKSNRKMDSKKVESIGKIIAAAKYFVESRLDEKAVLKKSEQPLLDKYISEESEAIEEVL